MVGSTLCPAMQGCDSKYEEAASTTGRKGNEVLWPERADWRPERVDLGPEKANERGKRADLKPEKLWWGQMNRSHLVFHRPLSPSRSLPKSEEKEKKWHF